LGNYIDIESLAKFLSTEANTKSTRGKYHELLDMILALYQIPIENDLPKFEVLDAKTFEQIYPKRVEYLICYWILHKISEDKFLSKYKFFDDKNLTVPLFQKLISTKDDRFYDVVFENLNIVLEIQENRITYE
jgi:anaerobic ribonucleoside-triphosphate reductase